MKKKTRIENERKIVSRETREMVQPRLTESVRKGFRAMVVEKPAAPSTTA